MPVQGQTPQQVRYQPGSESGRPTHWPMTLFSLICWYASLPVQAVILTRLARWRVPLPWFATLLGVEFARSAMLMRVAAVVPDPLAYQLLWALTEPFSLVAQVMAGLEVFCKPRLSWVGYVALVYAAVLGVQMQSSSMALVAARNVMLTLAIIGVVVIRVSQCVSEWRWEWHPFLFTIYSTSDLIQNASILGGASNEVRPAQFLILSQMSALIGWAIFVRQLRKPQ